MADYPAIATDRASQRTPRAGLIMDVADDGAPRGRAMYSSTLYDFTLIHPYITAAAKNSIMSHYAAHKAVPFGYTWPADAAIYSV